MKGTGHKVCHDRLLAVRQWKVENYTIVRLFARYTEGEVRISLEGKKCNELVIGNVLWPTQSPGKVYPTPPPPTRGEGACAYCKHTLVYPLQGCHLAATQYPASNSTLAISTMSLATLDIIHKKNWKPTTNKACMHNLPITPGFAEVWLSVLLPLHWWAFPLFLCSYSNT